MNVNVNNSKQASPLHFAVIYKEPKNVELLLKLKANPNAQDFQGHTPIHLALIKFFQDPDFYEDYKQIIK